MKRLVCVLLLAAPIVAAAQDTRRDEPPARGQLPAYYKRLGLSAEQEAKVRKVRADARAKIDALRAQIRAAQEEERRQLAEVLTPDHRRRLAELRSGEPARTKDGEKASKDKAGKAKDGK